MILLEEVWVLFQRGGVVLVVIMLLSTAGWFIGLRAFSALRSVSVKDRKVLNKVETSFRMVGAFAAVAPLLGLLGTVRGMMGAFGAIESFGVLDASIVSAGVSEALITTEAGLIVALPLLLISFYGIHRIESLRRGVEEGSDAQA